MLQLEHSLQGKMAAWWNAFPGWGCVCGDAISASCLILICSPWYPCTFHMASTDQRPPLVSEILASGDSSHCWPRRRVGKVWENDWFFSPPFVLLAFCSIHLCLFNLIGNTVFSCWGGWREGKNSAKLRRRNWERKGTYLCCDME